MGDADTGPSRAGAGSDGSGTPDGGGTPMAGSDGGSGEGGLTPPDPADASGYGVGITLVGAVLLALGYYGVLAVGETGEIGQALPEPFYILAVAVLFVVELLNSRHLGVVALARAIAFAAVYGGLFVLAAEGGASLWENPDLVLADYVGVTVFAVALVVSALAYVAYLTVVERGG
ncbi:hypothetical protein SAMN06269185_0861 [Natronoarchaeum philippinense]|uniref:Uncharacterized protein n=1 Tax=Natronoarchaeum philippinense TaxID=558529 RepID=A0A285N7I7_NATPI|nr:hypothetical protein [Natronoarchaeum philippinense]SNZ05444.1 hypothetical protein SAMN06269185_0861 [Natronoarchaeum philippinense]